MKRTATNLWITYIVTPFVAVGIFVGLWVALAAAYENNRLATATSQILMAVSMIREAPIDPNMDSFRATYALLERLSHYDRMHVKLKDVPDWPYMQNPWDGKLTVVVQPSLGQIGFDTPVSALVCQRLVSFFAKDFDQLGVTRITVADFDKKNGGETLLYNAKKRDRKNGLSQREILDGCGSNEAVSLRMVFSLK